MILQYLLPPEQRPQWGPGVKPLMRIRAKRLKLKNSAYFHSKIVYKSNLTVKNTFFYNVYNQKMQKLLKTERTMTSHTSTHHTEFCYSNGPEVNILSVCWGSFWRAAWIKYSAIVCRQNRLLLKCKLQLAGCVDKLSMSFFDLGNEQRRDGAVVINLR